MAGMFAYVNNEEHESKTDVSCKWNEASKLGKKKYKGGKELEDMLNLKDEEKTPPVAFDIATDEAKQKHMELMIKVA